MYVFLNLLRFALHSQNVYIVSVHIHESLNKEKEQSCHEFIENTYGSIDDETFIRHPQGEFEQRESIE